jgi:hypothetical protein
MNYLETATELAQQASLNCEVNALYGTQYVKPYREAHGYEEMHGYMFRVSEDESGEVVDTVHAFDVVIDGVRVRGRIAPTIGYEALTNAKDEVDDETDKSVDVLAEINDVITGKYTCSANKQM